MKWPADRILYQSEKSFGLYEEASRLEAEGIDVIHLEVGRPIYDTPEIIKAATKKALDDGIVHYGDFRGRIGFRQALAKKLNDFNKIDITPDEVLVTNGLTQASFFACLAAIDPGDEVIFLDPYYPQHIGKVEMAGGKMVTVPLDAEKNYALRADWIEEKITDKTRMIVLINPGNPTGRVHTRQELEALAALVIKHDLLVLSDEVYEFITYDGHQHISIAALDGMKERTFSCYAFTKAYAMDGWRLGYLATDAKLMPAILNVMLNDVTNVNMFIQEGGLAAVTAPDSVVGDMVASDKRKRDLVVQRLNQMPGVICPEPEGTIYVFPDISSLGKPSEQVAEELLREARVATEAGSFYGPGGEGHLRICFGSEPEDRLSEAMDRMARYFNK